MFFSELRAAKKQAAQALASENEDEEVVEDEVTDTVIEGNEPLEAGMSGMNTVSDEAEQALSESAAAETAQEGFVQAELPLENPSFQTKLSDRELAKKALQAARKAGSHRNGRR